MFGYNNAIKKLQTELKVFKDFVYDSIRKINDKLYEIENDKKLGLDGYIVINGRIIGIRGTEPTKYSEVIVEGDKVIGFRTVMGGDYTLGGYREEINNIKEKEFFINLINNNNEQSKI